MVSIHVLATPIRGRLRSASVNPMALNMERAPARSRPSVIPRLMCLRSMVKDYTTLVSDGKPETINHQYVRGEKRGTRLAAGSPSCMTLPRSRHACPANPIANLSPRRCVRLVDCHARGRVRRGPRGGLRRTGTHFDDIRDPVPLAVELADLLLVHIERQRDLVIVLSRLGLHIREIERTARSRIQNAHQRPLCVAIANVKSLHVCSVGPAFRRLSGGQFARRCAYYCAGSSSSNISESAAPAGTMGKTLASGAQSNTSNSGSGDRRNRSISSPVSFAT